MNTLCKSERSI